MTDTKHEHTGPPQPSPAPQGRRNGQAAVLTWSVTAILVVLTAVFIAVGMRKPEQEIPKPPKELADVEIVTVKSQEYVETLVLPAKVEADRSAVISSEMGGRLERWHVAEDAHVEANQLIARIDTADLLARKAQLEAQKRSAEQSAAVSKSQVSLSKVALSKAERDAAALKLELEAAQSSRELAENEFERVESLRSSEVTTKSQMDTATNALTQAKIAVRKAQDAIERAQIGVEAAKVQVAQAEAALGMAKAQVAEADSGIAAVNVSLAKAEIHAPFAGRLEKHLVEPGEFVSPGVPLARVYDLEHVRAVVDVADRYVPFLDASNPAVKDYIALAMPGAEQAVRARLVVPGPPKLTGGHHAGIEFSAEVARISQAADKASNTFEVELRLRNPGEALKEGIIGEAHIDYLRYAYAIVLPLRAIQVADVGPRVLVVDSADGENRAHVRDIDPVSIKGESVLVRSDTVKPGERLIVAGGKGVLDGEEVQVIVRDGVLQPLKPASKDSKEDETIKVAPDYEAGDILKKTDDKEAN